MKKKRKSNEKIIKVTELTKRLMSSVNSDSITLRKEREEKKKEIELLTEAEERLTNTFKALSLGALQTNNSNFLNEISEPFLSLD
ncbi:hypothetical protein X798_02010 [Onchocerca flexuosa]|uniref:Uncharacterized protein n=1 Tax=Onchocerca flexuosa TaxID=387005 RepID=A0A238C149_9BILA|nr:hypothetical protein X798_02010 [Onchocerca flexuosa]